MGIELFRGIAALMVLITHYANQLGLQIGVLRFFATGVDLFFVISGYVFAPFLLGRQEPILPYLVRRFFRIYPLYLLAVLVYFFQINPAEAYPGEILLHHLLFLHTSYSIAEASSLNGAFWSLPVEMEFYLLLPLLALLGRRGLLAVFAATSLLSMVANYQLNPQVLDVWRVLTVHLPTILPEFLVGSFIYSQVQPSPRPATATGQPMLERLAPWQSALAGMALLLYCYGINENWLNPLLNAARNVVCAAGYGLLLYPLLRISDKSYPPWLAKAARFSGGVSYGIYLFHNLLPRLVKGAAPFTWPLALLCTVLTILIAWILHISYEDPLRRWGRKLAAKLSAQAKTR